FKFLNLRGFADSYGNYDIIAKKWPGWGYIYPFVELGFAVLLLTGFQPIIVNAVIFVVMLVSCIGVFQSLLSKKRFQCACLGTVIKLPLSKVALVEDLLMVGMSLAMIIAIL
ncbi:MAG TPA: MauE/DoxX family redox-associated membrane protein, partial [Chitinophagaceae bacterium]